MQRGYVKLWRKSIDGGWLSNHKLWVFWCWCLMKASHKEYDLVVGYKQVHLMPGEFVFGLRKASEELKISVQSIRTILEFLKTSQNLTLKPTHHFSIISIINWDAYQSNEIPVNTPINTQVTHDQHTGNNKQECKEHKNKRNNIYTSEFESFWSAYPNKKEKQDAFRKWQKLNGQRPAIEIILNAIKKQIEWRATAQVGEFRPEWKHPSRWLSNWCWDDECKKSEVKNVGTLKKPYRTERDAINQDAGADADEIARKYYEKIAAANREPKENAG